MSFAPFHLRKSLRLQRQPNRWSCLPTAFAIAFDTPAEVFIEHIGHDGSEIMWPQLKEPMRRRGFHVQECIDVATRAGFAVTPFEMIPRHAPAYPVPAVSILFGGSLDAAYVRFARIIDASTGVITGHGCNTGHAVAYERGMILDPRGERYRFCACETHDFIPICAWTLSRKAT